MTIETLLQVQVSPSCIIYVNQKIIIKQHAAKSRFLNVSSNNTIMLIFAKNETNVTKHKKHLLMKIMKNGIDEIHSAINWFLPLGE